MERDLIFVEAKAVDRDVSHLVLKDESCATVSCLYMNTSASHREAPARPTVIVLMGVSGTGKTTVGKLLAAQWQAHFADADDYHPPANVAKMRSGQPLTEEDRRPWLAALRVDIDRWIAQGQRAVLGCSALTDFAREALGVERPQVALVHLTGSRELIHQRMLARKDHYMPPGLLDSQLATLQPPPPGLATEVDVTPSPEQIVANIRRRLSI